MLLVGLWVGGTFLAAQAAYLQERDSYYSTRFPEPSQEFVWDRILNPALAWSQLTFRFVPHGLEDIYNQPRIRSDGEILELFEIMPSLGGLAVMAMLARMLYLVAGRRFERDGLG
jgi:hypothetical protein